jgi:hypothetical protein
MKYDNYDMISVEIIYNIIFIIAIIINVAFIVYARES